MAVVDSKDIENIKWGNNSDSWALLRYPNMSIVQKQVSPGSSEVAHYHEKAHQFFFVLSGILTLDIEGETHAVKAQQGISVEPGLKHQLSNFESESSLYLLISSPNSKGDRVNL